MRRVYPSIARLATGSGAGQDDGRRRWPDGMRLFLVTAPAAIIAALLAAASTKGDTSPVAKALATGQPGNMPGTRPGLTSPQPCPGGYGQASAEVEPACLRGPGPGLVQASGQVPVRLP